MAFKLEIKGLDATVKRMESLARNSKRDANNALTKFANDVAASAKGILQREVGPHGNPTSNTGQLAGSINADNSNNLKASVTVAKNYAAFIEFGTKKYAASYVSQLPKDWQAYAMTFKGKGGGDFDDLVLAIYQWLRDRGIKPKKQKGEKSKLDDRLINAAYGIAFHIVKNGIKGKPFLYPSVVKHTPDLQKRLAEIFKGK